MTWQNPDTGEGFIPSHTGPCEVWLDNKRVFQNDDCATNFGDKPAAHLPVDYSSCAGDGCMLRFYWIALHQPEWQVYKNCVPLQGNGQNPGPAPQPNSGGQCANAKSDLDYYGNDIKNLGVWGSAQDQLSQCCAACSSTNGCAGFSINSGVCWLKHTLGSPTPRAGVVSASAPGASAGSSSQCGSSVSTDVDYYGNDIRSFGVNGDTAAQVAQCCNGCSTTTGCVGFSINANTCWLKSSVANPSPANGVVSVRMAQHRLRRAL
ncbi:hypothetical protein SDRG_17448 [Saprolegnia diclina VS20]|uniref:Apple domain-containing protein n=1 Tax=Saprolegnia diclina (strain VS20) TaxID=1156394 RepID=T0PH14_SAPDV|nr:hypothetical protein SDRG_17448 [Saprolegnia diclina VS20]EQC24659.1 hypothetical protein SDRG_17448 [Saprolegnia diclina VS20]|eukprot:XP_008621912.1 hypothetical protein SDRG_17448 [Saprolegnia diclina VS20]